MLSNVHENLQKIDVGLAQSTDVDLEISALVKHFGSTPILRGISLAVHRGSIVSLIGANGAGKSTLLRSCIRLVEPDSGSIETLGTQLVGARRKDLVFVRSQVGFVFQKHNLSSRLSVLSNVIHGDQARRRGPGTWVHSLAPTQVREEAMEMLAAVGLAHKATSRADQLSGGQSQRVAIARALMQRPRIILADEPVASLDPASGQEVMELLIRLARTQKATVIFTSHNLKHAEEYADRIVGLKSGRIALDEKAAHISTASVRELYV
ncbi:phosphonate ABC transporter ATP-binding protein [Microvirga sp. VF16]|uniref:phosphonate ABC transporter ATP-binding protein n=1 Tax=Microvirga sp. VF16 TaxID=2807101 RepID=UPI00193D77B9|nr:ATP-binding cassette domain-containing protein [Microvirga sp. VF16]QRM32352.1 ATP-binding cassette domain-containing protein [Microvirga sp. VF16]